MDKQESVKRNRKDKNKYLIISTSLGSLCMFLFSYFEYTKEISCETGGSKLPFIFELICHNFGIVGVSIMWALFGILFLIFTLVLLNVSKKSNKQVKIAR